MSKVSDLLVALRSGKVSLADAADALPGMLAKGTPPPSTPAAVLAADAGDATPFEPGTFDDVSAAYACGNLTDAQYAALAKAATRTQETRMTKQATTSGPGGQVEAIGATGEDPEVHALHEGRVIGTQPAPDATPEGAEAYFIADDGSDAWLSTVDGTLTGFLRRAGAAPVVYDTLTAWAADVDAIVMVETPVPGTEDAPAAPPPPPAPAAPAAAAPGRGAPAAAPAAARPNPFAKKAAPTPPPISRGSYVSGSFGKGRVDLIVTSGDVPGVTGDPVTGTAESPAARIVVWEQTDGRWQATGRKVASLLGPLKRIPPLTFGKSAEAASPGWAAAMDAYDVFTTALQDKGAAPETAPDPTAVKAVFERGVRAWPGMDATDLSPEQWAAARVETFLAKAAGEPVPDGYVRDDDLIPHLTPQVLFGM